MSTAVTEPPAGNAIRARGVWISAAVIAVVITAASIASAPVRAQPIAARVQTAGAVHTASFQTTLGSSGTNGMYSSGWLARAIRNQPAMMPYSIS